MHRWGAVEGIQFETGRFFNGGGFFISLRWYRRLVICLQLKVVSSESQGRCPRRGLVKLQLLGWRLR